MPPEERTPSSYHSLMHSEDTQPVDKHDCDLEPKKSNSSENDKDSSIGENGTLKSGSDSASVDSDQSSDCESSTFLVGSLTQLHGVPSTDSLELEPKHGKQLELNEVSSGALAMHHLYLVTMCLAYARRREVHKGSMNEVHSCNIERLCDNFNSIGNKPYPASIWKIWSSIKAEQENSPLLCDVVIDSIQQDLSDSSYIYVICHAPELDLVTVVLSTKPQRHMGQIKTKYNYDSKVAVGIDGAWSDIIGEDGSLIVEILSEVKRHPFSHLSFVGHGGGGAIAAICSIWACRNNLSKIVRVFSFGCPRIGDARFENLHNALQEEGRLQHLRFINEGDNFAQQPRYSIVSSKYCSAGTLVTLTGQKSRDVHQLETYWRRLGNWRVEMSMIEFIKGERHSDKKSRRIRQRLFLVCIIVTIYAPIIFLTQFSKVPRFFNLLVPKFRKILKVSGWKTSDQAHQEPTSNHVSKTREKPSGLNQAEKSDGGSKYQNRMRDKATHSKMANRIFDMKQQDEDPSQIKSSETADMSKRDIMNLDGITKDKYQLNQISTPDDADQTQSNENHPIDPNTNGIDSRLEKEKKEDKQYGRRNKADSETTCDSDKSLCSDCSSICIGQDTNCRNQSSGHALLNSKQVDEGKLPVDNVLFDVQGQLFQSIDDKVDELNNEMTMKYKEYFSSDIMANYGKNNVKSEDATIDRNMGNIDGTNEDRNNHQEYSDSTTLLDNTAKSSQPPLGFPGFHASRSFRRRPSLTRASSLEYCLRYEYSSVEFVFDSWKRNAWYKKNLADKEQIEAEVFLIVGTLE
mmetsp:Transcript_31183/g.47567  ORF Transcript_31183/g.47567 Transcript_31183/m.47567 type:complete len:800 (-) Transcript_31183:138-2537(-)